MNADLPFLIALTRIPQIGPVSARLLLETMGSAEAVFRASLTSLQRIPGLGQIRIDALRRFRDLDAAVLESDYVVKNNIKPLSILDLGYPQRLLQCPDAPLLLFQKGNADLNHSRVVAIVGTRSHSSYGSRITRELIEGLCSQNVMIVSGLAFGIDALAHRLSLEFGLITVGVMANGIDQIYPTQHRVLVEEMLQQNGAILTEYPSGTLPDRHHFPLRNRIVAGMADAVVVIETGQKGGSLITAELAWGYNRDLFAFPGRVGDSRSAGCNELIRKNKAGLLQSAADLIEALNWDLKPKQPVSRQRLLFADLDEDEALLAKILSTADTVSIDDLNWKSGLSNSRVASALLKMELKNLVVSLPGKFYQLQ